MSHLLAALLAASTPAIAQTPCAPLPGIEAVVARPDLRFLLIGEYHGTVEMPAVAGDAFCAAAETGRPVILGIEFLPENQPFLDAYLASDGGPAARAALFEAPNWREEGGRATGAVFDLIERARIFARAGRPVSVVAFDIQPTPTLSPQREAGLAAGLANAQMRVAGSLVVALTGLGHADKEGWISQSPPFLAAGGLLPGAHTVSLAFARPGGRYWGCHAANGDTAQGCTAYDMPVREPVAARGITLDPSLRGGFDGVYSAGAAYTASGPVAATAR